MKIEKLLSVVLLLCVTITFANSTENSAIKSSTKTTEFYQLKTYLFNSEKQLKTTESYLKNAYLPALKKIGITTIGVFKANNAATDSIQKIIVLIPFSSLEQFLNVDKKLAKDATYLNAGAQFLKADYKEAAYVRIESILLKAFIEHPFLTKPTLNSARENRIYELRSYESPSEAIHENKVDMFNAGGEVTLFDSLGFNAVFYGQVLSGAKMPNLMYLTTFADQASHDAHWKAFAAAPEWKALTAMEKYKNNVSHIDITLLHPTDYSDY